MLSHATLINIACDSKTAWLNSCRLSLGCVSDTALAHYLQEYPTTRNIVFALIMTKQELKQQKNICKSILI